MKTAKRTIDMICGLPVRVIAMLLMCIIGSVVPEGSGAACPLLGNTVSPEPFATDVASRTQPVRSDINFRFRQIWILLFPVALAVGARSRIDRDRQRTARERSRSSTGRRHDRNGNSENRPLGAIAQVTDPVLLVDANNYTCLGANAAAARFLLTDVSDLSGMTLLNASVPIQLDGTPSILALSQLRDEALAGTIPTRDWIFRGPRGCRISCQITVASFQSGGDSLMRVVLRELSNRHRDHAIHELLDDINEVVEVGNTLEYLLRFIRTRLSALIDSSNFCVALYNPVQGEYIFPFCDGRKQALADGDVARLRQNLTDYVRRSRTPLLADERVQHQLRCTGAIDRSCSASGIWMGVPLGAVDGISGVVSVYNVTTEKQYARDDLYLLIAIADRIGRQRVLESQLRLVNAIEQVGESIVLTDPSGTILYVNSAFERILGYSRTEVIGQNPRMFQSGVHSSDFYSRMWNAIAAGKMWSGEVIDQRKDGSLCTLQTTINPVRSDSGDLLGYVATGMDITDRKREQEEAARGRRLELAGRLAGQIAHDFNNLLGPLVAYPEMMRLRGIKDTRLLEMLDNMQDAALQIAEINQQLLTLGRRGHYNTEPLLFNQLVRQVLSAITVPDGITLRLGLDDSTLKVKGGPAQLGRVITNIVTNAIEAIGEQGVLAIETDSVKLCHPLRRYQTVSVGDYTRLRVSDTGCGIAPDKIDRVFEPFFGSKTANQRRGSGLGLSVVHSVVEDHHGYVDVESVEGQGTTVSVYLPACQEEIAQTHSADSLPMGNGEEILVADDDTSQLKILKLGLERLGYSVETVSSGEAAIEKLQSRSRDIVILDMVMEGIDGAETLERIRDQYPDQRVILLSGYASNERVQRAMELGALAFVQKPIHLPRLATALTEALGGRRPGCTTDANTVQAALCRPSSKP